MNEICKKLGHEFRYSRIFDDLVCCRICGTYKRGIDLRKEEKEKNAYNSRRNKNGN